MKQIVNSLALVASVTAALLTALAGACRDLPAFTLAMRCSIAALVVYGFVKACGDLVGRALLRGLAERQVDSEQSNEEASGTPRKQQAA